MEIHYYGKIFNLGIYNIVTAENDIEFKEQLKKTLSKEGMTFGNSMQYRVDFNINIGNSTTKIQKEFIKTKQTISIGVIGTEKHIGATSMAINLCKFLNEYQRSCYIEYNSHNTIKTLNGYKDSLYYEDKKKIEYQGIELYEKPENIATIQNYDYSFYIYDYGYLEELSSEERNSFLLKDLKFVVTSSCRWEFSGIVESLFLVNLDNNSHFYVINTNLEDRENFRKNFDKRWRNKVFFAPSNSNPFKITIENRDYYNKILEPYLLNSVMEEKTSGFMQLFKKKRKG